MLEVKKGKILATEMGEDLWFVQALVIQKGAIHIVIFYDLFLNSTTFLFFRYVLVGVTAWGVRPCGKKDQPGIYASVSDSLCFIFWSSECYSGSNPFQDFEPYCKTWIEDEISEVENSRPSSKYVENLNDLKNCKIID